VKPARLGVPIVHNKRRAAGWLGGREMRVTRRGSCPTRLEQPKGPSMKNYF